MAGLAPANHFETWNGSAMDGRLEGGHDGGGFGSPS
jgi:hypothetical protein